MAKKLKESKIVVIPDLPTGSQIKLFPLSAYDDLIGILVSNYSIAEHYYQKKTIKSSTQLRKILLEIQKKCKAERQEIILRRKTKKLKPEISEPIAETTIQDPNQLSI